MTGRVLPNFGVREGAAVANELATLGTLNLYEYCINYQCHCLKYLLV